jgi:copper chaperone CopZ
MATLSYKVGHVYCFGCVHGLSQFVGKMKGVNSISVKNNDSVVVDYDPEGLDVGEEQFKTIVRDSIERLGFRIREH